MKVWRVIWKWGAVNGWFCFAYHWMGKPENVLLFGISCTIAVALALRPANQDLEDK